MIHYFTSVITYFIILSAIAILVRPMIERYDIGIIPKKKPNFLSLFLTSLIPIFRFLVAAAFFIIAFAPQQFVDEVNRQIKEKTK